MLSILNIRNYIGFWVTSRNQYIGTTSQPVSFGMDIRHYFPGNFQLIIVNINFMAHLKYAHCLGGYRFY